MISGLLQTTEYAREFLHLACGPGATLIPLPGSSYLFYHGDWMAVADAMLGFLLRACEHRAARAPRSRRG